MKIFFKIVVENIKELGFICFTFYLVAGCTTYKQLSISRLFNDNMVIQRNQPIKVWGMAKEGANVKIKFNNGKYETTSVNSKWQLIKMTFKGNKIEVCLDGKNIVTVNSESNKNGIVFLGTGWNTAYFDNLKIEVEN